MASATLPLPRSTSSPGRTPGLVAPSNMGAGSRAAAVARAWNSILGDEAEEEDEVCEVQEDQQEQQGKSDSKKEGHLQKGPRTDEGIAEKPRPRELRGLEEAEALSAHFSPGRAAQIWEKLHTWRAIEFGAPGSLFHRCCLLDWQGRVVSPWHHVPLHRCDAALHFICTTPQDTWLQLEVAPEEEFNPLQAVRRLKKSTLSSPTSNSTDCTAASNATNGGRQPNKVRTRTLQPDSHGIIAASLPELGTQGKGSYTEGFSFAARGVSLGHVRAQSLTTQSSSAFSGRLGAGPDASSSGARRMKAGGEWDEEHEEKVVRQRKARAWKELHSLEPGHYAENSIFNIGFLPQTWEDPSSPLFPMSQTRGSSRSSSRDGSGLASASVLAAASSSPGSNSASLGSECEAAQAGGAGRPLEAIEIGMRRARPGEVYSTKPLAAFAVEERGGFAWKVVVIATDDALAPQLHGLADLERLYPAVLEQIQEWLRFSCFRTSALDEEATILCGGQPQDVVTSLVVVAEAHSAWQLQFHDAEVPSSPWQVQGVPGAGLPNGPAEPQTSPWDMQGQAPGGLARLAKVLEREWERRGHILPLARSAPGDLPPQTQEQLEGCAPGDGEGASCTLQAVPAGKSCELGRCQEPSAFGQRPLDTSTEDRGQGVSEGCRLQEGMGSPTEQTEAQPGLPCTVQEVQEEQGQGRVGTRLGPLEEAHGGVAPDQSLGAAVGVTVDDLLQCISLSDRRVFSGRSLERERARMGPGAGLSSSNTSSTSSSTGPGTSSTGPSTSSSGPSTSSALCGQIPGSRTFDHSTSSSASLSSSIGASLGAVAAANKSAKGRRGRSRSDWNVPGDGRSQAECEGRRGPSLGSTGRAVSWTAAAATPGRRGSEKDEGPQEQGTKWEALLPQPLCGNMLVMLRGAQKGPVHAHRDPVPEALALREGDEEGEGEGEGEGAGERMGVPEVSPKGIKAASVSTAAPGAGCGSQQGMLALQQQEQAHTGKGGVAREAGGVPSAGSAAAGLSSGAAGPSAPRRRSVRGLALLGRREAGGSRGSGSGEASQDAEARRARSRSWTGGPLGSSPMGSKAASPAAGLAEAVGGEAGDGARKGSRGAGRCMRWSAGNWHELSHAPGLFLGSAARDRKPKAPLRGASKATPKAGAGAPPGSTTGEHGSRSKGRNRTPSPGVASGRASELPAPLTLEVRSLSAPQGPQTLPSAPSVAARSPSLPGARSSGRRGREGRGEARNPRVSEREKEMATFGRSYSFQVRPSSSANRDTGRRAFSPPSRHRKPGGARGEASPGLISQSSSFSSSAGSSSKGSSRESSNSSSNSNSRGRDRSSAYVRSSSLPSNRVRAGPSFASVAEQRSTRGDGKGGTGDAPAQRQGVVRRQLVVSSVQLSDVGDRAPEVPQQQEQSLVNPGNDYGPGTGTGDPGTGTGDPGTGAGDPGTGAGDPGTGTGDPGTGTGDPGTGVSTSESPATAPQHLGPHSGESALHKTHSSSADGPVQLGAEGAATAKSSSELCVGSQRGVEGPSSPHQTSNTSHTATGLGSTVPEAAQAAPRPVAFGRSGSDSAGGHDEGTPRASSFARKRQVSFHNIVEVVQFIEEYGAPQAPAKF